MRNEGYKSGKQLKAKFKLTIHYQHRIFLSFSIEPYGLTIHSNPLVGTVQMVMPKGFMRNNKISILNIAYG